jgi:hypothetical protein
VSVESYGNLDAQERLWVLESLRVKLQGLRGLEVLAKQIGQYVVDVCNAQGDRQFRRKQQLLLDQHNHESWDLQKDSALLPLLMKRRKEIGQFYLLKSEIHYALFAKLVLTKENTDGVTSPGNLVQYQLAISDDQVDVHLHMECESGVFQTKGQNKASTALSTFARMAATLRKRDQECAKALRCRTRLLGLSNGCVASLDIHKESISACVERLIAYSSEFTLRLRFFGGELDCANEELYPLTRHTLLSQSFGVRTSQLTLEHSSAGTKFENLGPGDWYLLAYDSFIMSIAHFGMESYAQPGNNLMYRDVTFFTTEIGDVSEFSCFQNY